MVDAATVNFVKYFMAKKGLGKHPVAKHIINARGPGKDPFAPCNFGG
jgi:hypothetical protein